MIVIKNSTKKIQINEKSMREKAQIMLESLGYSDFDLGIFLTTNQTIRRYNAQFRHKDKATDILSFPFYPELKPGERIIAQSPEEQNLGDLIISLEYVQHDAANWGQSFEERMDILLAHGIAHLLNYDHITEEEYASMQIIEKKLLAAIQAKNPKTR